MATGSEMAMGAVFKWLGVDPVETKTAIATAYGKVIGFDARLIALETALRDQNELLALIAKHLEDENAGTKRIGTAEGGERTPYNGSGEPQ